PTLFRSEAVRIALVRQPTLEAVRQAVIEAEGRARQLRSRLLPQFAVSGTHYSSHFVGNEPARLQLNNPNGYGSSAIVTQLVFDFNHSADLARQSKALKEVAV